MYNWMLLAILSGILFGFYDISTKKALSRIPLFNVLASYTVLNFILVSFELRNALKVDTGIILIIFIKCVMIFSSWTLSFLAIKGLPISIITPFGTLTPLMTIILSVFLLNERLGFLQFFGIIIILSAYYLIGRIGTTEVKGLFKNKFFYCMIGSTLFSTVSSLIDKLVLKKINSGQMQFWFSLFLAVMYTAALLLSKIKDKDTQIFKINYYVILMSILLIVSDRIYFSVVHMPASQISIVMPLRRISVFVSAIVGGFVFKEKNLKKKFLCACILIAGIALVFAGQ